MNKQQIDPLSPELPSNEQQDKFVIIGGLAFMLVAATALLNLKFNNWIASISIVATFLVLLALATYLGQQKSVFKNVSGAALAIIVITVAFNVVRGV